MVLESLSGSDKTRIPLGGGLVLRKDFFTFFDPSFDSEAGLDLSMLASDFEHLMQSLSMNFGFFPFCSSGMASRA